jgi:8-oxo-dGTP pyrophosphatase MutT (NUDIX family)
VAVPPSARSNPGSPEDAAVREMFEETSFVAAARRILGDQLRANTKRQMI